MRKRSNAGLFQRLLEAGSTSKSHKGELKSRRKQKRLEAAREREAEREEIRRERQKVRDANKLKRQLLAEERREDQRRRKEEEREAPHKAMPSASAIERAYKRGAKSLSEAMEMARGNPHSNPTKRLSLAKPKDFYASGWGSETAPAGTKVSVAWSPGIGMATVYWRKAGRLFESVLDAADIPGTFRRWPSEWALSNPRGSKGKFQRCVEAVSKRGGAKDPKAVCGAMEKRLRKNPEDAPNKRAFVGARRKDGKYPVQLVYPLSGKRLSKLMTQEQVDRLQSEGYDVFGSRPNPADAAMAVSEEFHGRPVKAMVPVQQKRHYHKYLAELGELRKLVVEIPDGKSRVTLSKFDGGMLCSNEDRNQLFIVGGDQSVNLSDFGIRNPHEIETLGEVVKIEYFTDKEHLGNEGGEAVYVHKFRATNDNGKHKTVKMARNPNLIYYLRDEHLEFSGGSYEIRAEGIDK